MVTMCFAQSIRRALSPKLESRGEHAVKIAELIANATKDWQLLLLYRLELLAFVFGRCF